MTALSDKVSFAFQYIAYASACAAVLVILVLCCEFLLPKRLPAGLRFACWLMVFTRLALPVLPASPFSLYNLAEPGTAPSTVAGPQTLREGPDLNAVLAAAPYNTPAVPAPRHTIGLVGVLACVWSAISVLLLAGMCIEAVRFSRRLSRHRIPVSRNATVLLQELSAALRIRRTPEICETTLVSVPALAGVWRPTLLLPAGFVSVTKEDMLRHVLLHELAHLRRGDLVIHQLARIALAIHWFNPFAWIALRRLRFVQELSCDASVLRQLQPEEIPMYGRTLIALQERMIGKTPRVAALAMLTARPQTTARIHAIAYYKPPRTPQRIAVLLVVFVLGAVVLTDAQEQQPEAAVPATQGGGIARPPAAPPQGASKPPRIEEVLRYPVSLHFEGTELAEIVDLFAMTHEINFVMDLRAILPPGVKSTEDDTRRETYVKSVELDHVTLGEGLKAILQPLGLDYKVQPGFIWISLPETLRHESFEELETRYYEAPGIVDGKLKDVNGGETDLDLVTFIQSRVPVMKEPRTGELLSAMHWDNDRKMLIVRDVPENFIQIEALIEAIGIPTEEQPPVQAELPESESAPPPIAHAVTSVPLLIDLGGLAPLKGPDRKRLGFDSVTINLLRDASPVRPFGQAVINLEKVQIGELIPGTKAKLIGIDETRAIIGIEMTDTGERYRFGS